MKVVLDPLMFCVESPGTIWVIIGSIPWCLCPLLPPSHTISRDHSCVPWCPQIQFPLVLRAYLSLMLCELSLLTATCSSPFCLSLVLWLCTYSWELLFFMPLTCGERSNYMPSVRSWIDCQKEISDVFLSLEVLCILVPSYFLYLPGPFLRWQYWI